jgi:hypothetical protein
VQLDRWNNDHDVAKDPEEQHDCQQQQQDVPKQKKKKKKKQGSDQGQQAQQQQQQPQKQSPYQYSLQLLVPPGQLELGRRLITAMYSSSPDLSNLEAPQLMQLVALAECYGVGKVVTAAAKQLQQLSVETMPLGTAAAVFEMPEACLGLEAFKGVQATAVDKLQQELGDLEVVWGDKGKQQALLGLPYGALRQLLGDERTQVASEDTAVYTARRWLQENLHPDCQQQRQQQLLGVLRLPHCTPTYLAGVVAPAASLLRAAGLTEAEALGLCTLPAPGSEQRTWRLKNVFGDRAAWQLPSRPASSVKVLHVQWQLPLAELQEVVQQKTSASLTPDGSQATWCGRVWGMTVESCDSRLGLFLRAQNAPAGFDAKYSAMASGAPWVSRSLAGEYVKSNTSWGYPKLLEWGADKEWPQVKEWLEQQKLVHPDKCLHLRIAVYQVC